MYKTNVIAKDIYSDESFIAKPVLKWAGGKRQLLPQINKKLPEKLKLGGIKTYIEPFIGGGAVFFYVYNNYPIKKAFLFDVNEELIILYNTIKNDVHLLIEELKIISVNYLPLNNEKRKDLYYKLREEYNLFDKNINANNYTRKNIRRAALTIFLNKTCFNGLFRVNKNKYFNVPVGKYKNPLILDEENLYAASEALQIATIKQTDFSETIKHTDNNSFVYYDPPYRPIKKTSNFKSYSSNDFDDNEQIRLKKIFDKVEKKGALQMLSNSDPTNYFKDPFFDDLYKNYKIERISARRVISSDYTSRGSIRELIITNY